MFFLKIFYFLKGYVIIDIKGKDTARFINICTARGIRLFNIKCNRAFLWESDFKKIRPAARKAGVKIKIVKKCGFCRKYILGGGWFALICAALFALFFLISSQYLWSVSIEGCDGEIKQQVEAQAQRIGIMPGTRKNRLPDANTMRDEILYNTEGINWVWVYIEGTHARISVSENIPAPAIDDDRSAGNISASREGILSFVSAQNGRAVMTRGMKVEPGDVVISGLMPGGQMTPPYEVCAKGEVFAETVHVKTCEYPLYKVYTHDTGAEYTRYSLRIFELEIPLSFGKKPDFEEYRTQIKTPPVGVCSIRYIETETTKEAISLDSAVYDAREAMYEQIAAELAPQSRKKDENLTYEKISDEKVRVTLTMSFTENIGVKTPIEAWQTEELNK